LHQKEFSEVGFQTVDDASISRLDEQSEVGAEALDYDVHEACQVWNSLIRKYVVVTPGQVK